MYIIIALGNTGERYTQTRHNVGWIVVDEILDSADWQENKYGKCLIHHGMIGNQPVEYVKPLTMMNLSGQSLAFMVKNYPDITGNQIIVIHDDIALPVGEFRISYNRGSGSHNGVESINETLGNEEYIRIRIGIGDKGEALLSDYVLGRLPPRDMESIRNLAPTIYKALEVIMNEGHEIAMNQYN